MTACFDKVIRKSSMPGMMIKNSFVRSGKGHQIILTEITLDRVYITCLVHFVYIDGSLERKICLC